MVGLIASILQSARQIAIYDEKLLIISKEQKQSPEVFCKNNVLRNFVKLTGKHLRKGLFFNKVAGWGWGLQLY